MKIPDEDKLSEVDALKARVRMLDDAINGWRKVDAEKAQKIADLEALRLSLLETNNRDLERRREAEAKLERLWAVIDALSTDVVRKGKLISAMETGLSRARVFIVEVNTLLSREPVEVVLKRNVVNAIKKIDETLEKRGSYERENRAD